MEKYKLKTKALHSGYEASLHLNARAVPIYNTTSYVFENAQAGADLFALKKLGFIYSRLNNPTVDVLEKRLAAYHGASAAVATASGAAANTAVFLALAGAGDTVVASKNLYGGTVTLLEHTLKRFGLKTVFLDVNDENALRQALDSGANMVFAEAAANPGGHIIDFEKVAAITHEYALPLVIDNSATPPPLINPFDYGADVLTYSLTKMIGGHGTHLGGLVLEKGDFDWGKNLAFSNYLNGPDEAYGGLNFWQTFGLADFKEGGGTTLAMKIRLNILRDMGAALSPFGAHEILLGLETLPLRAQQQAESARQVAEYLAAHPQVAWVTYGGLAQSGEHRLATKYFAKHGPGAVFGFGLKGGYEAAVGFIDALKLFSHLANILDARSLVIHPASTTHQQLSPEARILANVPDDLIRLSIGLEDVDDIIGDLDEAFRMITAQG
ncbi:MAG: O-acetylhomoserine aminocarboxypropyltransferase/cysteine synthase family protein [Candidatus Adiutrix sp.]